MAQEGNSAALLLPDGTLVRAEVHEGAVNAHERDQRRWKSLDLALVRPDHRHEVLCSVDYEDQKGLRVLAFEQGSTEPVYERRINCASVQTGQET